MPFNELAVKNPCPRDAAMLRRSMLLGTAAVVTACSVAEGQQSWWYFSTDDGAYRLEADGTSPQWLTTDDPDELFKVRLAADPSRSRLYGVRPSGLPFVYTDLDGQDLTVFSPTVFPKDIAVDRSGNLFASTSRRIMRIEAGNAVELTFQSPGVNDGIAIDDTNDLIYWTRSAGNERFVYRSNKDGSDLQLVVGGIDYETIAGIAVSPDGSRVFWSVDDGPGTGGEIWTALSDGTGVTRLISGLPNVTFGLVMNPLDDKLYIAQPTVEKIYRMNMDGSGLEVFFDGAAFGLDIADISLYIAPSPATAAAFLVAAVGLASRRRRQ